MFDEENVFTFENKKYERLYNHPLNIKYRMILSDDDYDYVDDEELINRLDNYSHKEQV